MRSSYHAAHPKPAAVRMIWLPGAYNDAQDFVRAGFAAAVSSRGLALDLEFVDLELRYLGDGAGREQLHGSLIAPLRAAGIAVWLAGISLGGLLALDFAASYEDDLAGLCVFAPYPGNRMLLAEIARAPGLHNWRPGEEADSDAERRMWRYVQRRRTDAAPLYLGYGKQDRFSAGLALLAANLAADSVDVIEGGHDWSTWARLWENFLESRFI